MFLVNILEEDGIIRMKEVNIGPFILDGIFLMKYFWDLELEFGNFGLILMRFLLDLI